MALTRFIAFLVLLCLASFGAQSSIEFSSRLDYYKKFEGENILPRDVIIWLPASYFSSPKKRYAVIYAHDGQNLFFPEFTYAGKSWEIEASISRLTREGFIKDVIIVGISNTKNRRLEYYPQASLKYVSKRTRKNLNEHSDGPPRGDAYLSFIVHTLKPFVDQQYRTISDRENTFLLGSSMGGVISLYGAIRYPEVFGASANISTHWPLNHFIKASPQTESDELANAFIRYVDENLPPAKSGLRLYFDHGDQGVDAKYAPYQQTVNSILEARDYKKGTQWVSRYFPGEDHNEASWSKRLDIPLRFLLAK